MLSCCLNHVYYLEHCAACAGEMLSTFRLWLSDGLTARSAIWVI